jgi:hypothetical protein
MIRLINGILLSSLLFVGLLLVIAMLGAPGFARLTRPNSQGYIHDVIELKLRVAKSTPSPKIVVVSGSGGLYSISCTVLSRELRMPCVNEGLPIDIGVPGLLEQGRATAKPGDIIFMPLEFPAYYTDAYSGGSGRAAQGGMIDRIRGADLRRLFRVDLRYVITGIAERIMWAYGYRAYSLETMFAPNADRIGTSAAAAEVHRSRRAATAPNIFSGIMTNGFRAAMTDFLQWAHSNGITVVATLPTVYHDTVVERDGLSKMARFYTNRNAVFYLPEDLYRYDRDCFFDGDPHLNLEWQAIHSSKVARDLLRVVPDYFQRHGG